MRGDNSVPPCGPEPESPKRYRQRTPMQWLHLFSRSPVDTCAFSRLIRKELSVTLVWKVMVRLTVIEYQMERFQVHW
jgi:hypothetical protein